MGEMTPICRIYARYKQDYKYPKLGEAYNYCYGKEPPNPHTARGDTIISTLIAIKYLRLKRFQKLLFCCAEEQIPISIKYRDRQNHESIRTIIPKALKRSNTLLEALDINKQEERTFNLIRIEDILVK